MRTLRGFCLLLTAVILAALIVVGYLQMGLVIDLFRDATADPSIHNGYDFTLFSGLFAHVVNLWTRYLLIIVGAFLVAVGVFVICARILTPAASQAEITIADARVLLTATSPGLIVAALGCALLITVAAVTPRATFSSGGEGNPASESSRESDAQDRYQRLQLDRD